MFETHANNIKVINAEMTRDVKTSLMINSEFIQENHSDYTKFNFTLLLRYLLNGTYLQALTLSEWRRRVSTLIYHT